MSLHRRAARRDESEAAIVEYLRKAGWSVLLISVKDGPDAVIGKHGLNLMTEHKTGKKKLRPGQVKFGESWNGDPPYVLRSVEDAMALDRAASKLSLLPMKKQAKVAYDGATAAGRNTRHGFSAQRKEVADA